MVNGEWNIAQLADRAWDIEGMNVGTVGAGRIGLRVLERLKPFDCKLHYTGTLALCGGWDPSYLVPRNRSDCCADTKRLTPEQEQKLGAQFHENVEVRFRCCLPARIKSRVAFQCCCSAAVPGQGVPDRDHQRTAAPGQCVCFCAQRAPEPHLLAVATFAMAVCMRCAPLMLSPASQGTENLFNAKLLAQMQPGSYLVNTGPSACLTLITLYGPCTL